MKEITESNKVIALQNELNKLNEKRISIQNQIEEIEQAEVLPIHIAKYEGKYFKYQNASGPDDKWWLYIYVSKVSHQRLFKGYKAEGFYFQKTNSGEIIFKAKNIEHLLDSSTEISKSEFRNALTKINSSITALINTLP